MRILLLSFVAMGLAACQDSGFTSDASEQSLAKRSESQNSNDLASNNSDGADGQDTGLFDGADGEDGLGDGDGGEDGGFDSGSDSGSDSDNDSDLSGGRDGDSDEEGDILLEEDEQIKIIDVSVGADGIILYLYSSGLDLWNPGASAEIQPGDALSKLNEIGDEAIASGVALKDGWGGWGMYARQISPRVTTGETTIRTRQCADDEVVVGYPAQGPGNTSFQLVCAKLKDDFEVVDRQTINGTWDESQRTPCPSETVMVAHLDCARSGCVSPSSFQIICGRVERR